MADNTSRVELDDGNWIDVRTKITLADAEVFERARLSRDKPSDLLDSIAVVQRLVKAWSYDPPVTPENISDCIGVNDILKIVEAINVTVPPPLAASSNGTPEDNIPETTAAQESLSLG